MSFAVFDEIDKQFEDIGDLPFTKDKEEALEYF